ncbi:MAG: YicC family protein [Methylobacteriaceae bacterium]|nr:YicC family protein [Methylobacteriaceae bacterium]
MPIRSMTGFARVAGTSAATGWAWELKAVNGRNLEVRTRVPPGFDAVGEEARRLVLATLSRGQCQLGLTLTRPPSAPRVRLNEALLGSLLASLRATELPDGVRPVSLDGLLAVRGVVEVEDEPETAEAEEALRHDLLAAIPTLAAALVGAREEEGAALAGILERLIADMTSLIRAATDAPGRKPEAVRARLAAQVATLLETEQSLDPARLHQEAVLLATRADIQEELDRLEAHLASARELIGQDGAVGRRLDFLAQEFGREANTLCSKANDVDLSRIGLELKTLVEQFREQVANVE